MKKVLVALVAVVLVSCGGASGEASVKSEKTLVDGFQRMQASFSKTFDEQGSKEALNANADSLVTYFDALAKNYPENSSLSKMCFVLGEVSMKVNKGKDAVKYFDALEIIYPEDENVSKALYLKAHTFEDMLKDTVQAIAAYKHLYKTYPESKWSQNAKNQVLRLNNPNAVND